MYDSVSRATLFGEKLTALYIYIKKTLVAVLVCKASQFDPKICY